MTHASIYITDDAGDALWLFRAADGYPTGPIQEDLGELGGDDRAISTRGVADLLLEQRYAEGPRREVYAEDIAPHRSSMVAYIYAVRLLDGTAHWRHWDASGRDRRRVAELAMNWARNLRESRLRQAADRQRGFAVENREIADELQESEHATVRELAAVYRETARRHDACADQLENEARGRETAPGQGEANRG